MKIYTRTGDDGSSGLIGGSRVAKDDARLNANGTVDELNATVGLATVATHGQDWAKRLAAVQAELFVIGSHLATPSANRASANLPPLDVDAIARLEREIDAADAVLRPLTTFVLPGGSESAARLHLARCVCRRAERLAVAFGRIEPIEPFVVRYLNRLSDWLFTMSRLANHEAALPDVPWTPNRA